MEAKDIKNYKDMQRYIEGCLNDLMDGISTKEETMTHMKDYTLRIIDIVAGIHKQEKDNDNTKRTS